MNRQEAFTENARAWVSEERSWARIGDRVADVYRELGAAAAG